jgi:hypothetical protein
MATLPVLPNGHFGLQNNMVYYFPLQDEDVNNNIVPAPTGDVVTPVATGAHAASLAFAVGAMPAGSPNPGAPAIVGTPMVVQSDAGNGGGGIGLTLTDTAGLAENTVTSSALFDITVPPPGPATAEGVDFPGVFVVAQPTPAAPGP